MSAPGPAAGRDANAAERTEPRTDPWKPDGCPRRLDPRSITVQRIAGAIAAAILALLTLIAVVAVLAASGPTPGAVAAWLGGWLALTAAAGAWSQLWPGIRYRHVSWSADAAGLRIDSGVWWRSTVSVPRSRVQHTDVQQGPIDRAFGLAALVVHTAGTHHASVPLSGLAHPDALRLRDFLIEDAPGDGDG